MTATTATNTIAPAADVASVTDADRRPLWVPGLLAGVVAAAATTLVVVAAGTIDIDAATSAGEEIPLLGFAQLTLVGAILGVLIAKVCRRRSARPRRAFVVTTLVLLALSIVPDVLFDGDVATRLLLTSTHLLAAAIIVPTLARRLPVGPTRP